MTEEKKPLTIDDVFQYGMGLNQQSDTVCELLRAGFDIPESVLGDVQRYLEHEKLYGQLATLYERLGDEDLALENHLLRFQQCLVEEDNADCAIRYVRQKLPFEIAIDQLIKSGFEGAAAEYAALCKFYGRAALLYMDMGWEIHSIFYTELQNAKEAVEKGDFASAIFNYSRAIRVANSNELKERLGDVLCDISRQFPVVKKDD